MSDLLARTGIPAVGPVPWGSHFCQFYDDARDMADTLVPFFKTGLENNELCHWVTSEHFSSEDAKSALRAAYPRLDDALDEGRIIILNRHEWYQRGGGFSAEDVVAGWLKNEEESRSKGYAGYRLTGDTLWLEPHDWDAFTAYEAMVNEAFSTRRMLALCTYCMGRCGAHEVLDVVSNHSFAVARRSGDWQVVESAAVKAAKAELAELNASLERRVAEATLELKTALSHKDALLREVHHRVKNNLQVVANLLKLKGREAPPVTRAALQETADRVRAISAVHEALYDGMAGDRVDMKARLRAVTDHLSAGWASGGRVAVRIEGDALSLPLDRAVPLALIATEAVSNALKHAFPDGREGTVTLTLEARGEEGFVLTVRDDGAGPAEHAAATGAGMGIVQALARQLDARASFDRADDGGGLFRVETD